MTGPTQLCIDSICLISTSTVSLVPIRHHEVEHIALTTIAIKIGYPHWNIVTEATRDTPTPIINGGVCAASAVSSRNILNEKVAG